MNIKEINGYKLKRQLPAKSIAFVYKTKNLDGGHFKIKIVSLFNNNYELSGEYDKDGMIKYFRFGLYLRAGKPFLVSDFSSLIAYIIQVIK